MNEQTDPVLMSRERVAVWVSIGLRAGYGLFATAMMLFFSGFVFDFTGGLTTAITFCLIAGSVILAPSIVFNYGVKAANRADRDGTW